MRFRPAIEPMLLALILGLLWLWPVRSPPIAHHGEAREGLVVQAIVDRGEWVLPRRNGELPSKPPLFHWLAAGAALGFGFSDGALRLPSVVAAWGVTCLTFALGRAMGGAATGWLAVGALLATVPFLTSAFEARVDMVFAACTTAALSGFFLWYRDRSPRARLLLYAATSGAVLAKGPVGAVLPALVIVVFLVTQGELRLLRALWSGPLVAMAVVVDLGWYALATATGGREFVELQLLRENWSRFVGSQEFRRTARGQTLRMPVLLATQFLPWILAPAWSLFRRVRGARWDAAERFLHAWWIVVLVLFTVGAGKRPVYLLPAAPAIALLAGRLLATAAAQPREWFGLRLTLARLAVALAIVDVGTLTALQVVRESRVGRRSLVGFAAKVAELAPGNAPLPAVSAIRASDRMVLAYRLRRPVPREVEVAPGLPYLVPADTRLARWCGGATLLAESGESTKDFALMRTAAGAPSVRPLKICEDEVAARSGAIPDPGLQTIAGSDRRVLIPFGDPSPPPAP